MSRIKEPTSGLENRLPKVSSYEFASKHVLARPGVSVEATGFAVLGVTAAAMFLPVVFLLLPLRELQPGQWTDITREPASE